MRWELMMFVGAGILVSGACLVPGKWLPALPNDKLLHFAAFGALTLLAARLTPDAAALAPWLAGLLLAGALIECLQQYVPGRRFCWRDLGANAAGIACAALLAQLAR